MADQLMKPSRAFQTHCVHTGEIKDTLYHGVVSPIYLSTAYAFDDVETKRYPRYYNTPNQEGLNLKLAALEGGEKALVFGSGMAAVSSALIGLLQQGDHVVFQNDIYGGTRNFIKTEFPKQGITFDFTEGLQAADFEKLIGPNTKGLYIETPSNPLLKLVDLEAISKLATARGLWTMIDNTFASPVNQNPIAWGIDIVLHSATKYLGGHSDITAGAVIGSASLLDRIYQSAINYGGSLSDMTVWLLERSIKTLSLRVQAQNQNALSLAHFLDAKPEIQTVYYPGLSSHPDHDLATRQMKGFGGMLSFELGPGVSVNTFLRALQLIKPAMSLAGVESTVLQPRLASHALLTEEERLQQGITPGLIRFSCGIEAKEDLCYDLEQALNKAVQ